VFYYICRVKEKERAKVKAEHLRILKMPISQLRKIARRRLILRNYEGWMYLLDVEVILSR